MLKCVTHSATSTILMYCADNYVVWGASVECVDGAEAALKFQAQGYPYLGVFAATPASTATRPKYQKVFTSEKMPNSPGELVR
jgi:hypothetical protein